MNTSFTLPSTTVPNPMEAPALRWGVISPGGIARKFVATMHATTGSRLHAVCSRSLDRAQAFASEFESDSGIAQAFDSLEEFLSSGLFDIVYLASPHGQHHELAKPVIEAGIPIVVEKAFTLNTAQAEELLELARRKGTYVQEAMWSRFMPHYDVIKQVIEQGLIGEVRSVISDHGQHMPFNPKHRLYAPELGGGALLDLGVYPIALAHWVAGQPTEILASGTLAPTGVDDNIAISAKAGATVYSLHTTCTMQSANVAQILGTKGKIEIDPWYFTPVGFTVTLHDENGEQSATTRFTYEDSLTYPFPQAPQNTDYGMAFEIAEAARNVTAGKLESERLTWQHTLEIMRFMDEVRRQVGVVYPIEAQG